MVERDLFDAISENRLAILPVLNSWKEEVTANSVRAASEPGYTLGTLLGCISDICQDLPKTYTLIKRTDGQDHYNRINLSGSHEYYNDAPERSAAAAFFQAERKAVAAILGACFRIGDYSRPSASRKRPLDEQGEGLDSQLNKSSKESAKKVTQLRVNLTEHSHRGLLAALALRMKWTVDWQTKKDKDIEKTTVTLTIDPNDSRPSWVVVGAGIAEKSARQAATIKFFELLNMQGNIRPVSNLTLDTPSLDSSA